MVKKELAGTELPGSADKSVSSSLSAGDAPDTDVDIGAEPLTVDQLVERRQQDLESRMEDIHNGIVTINAAADQESSGA